MRYWLRTFGPPKIYQRGSAKTLARRGTDLGVSAVLDLPNRLLAASCLFIIENSWIAASASWANTFVYYTPAPILAIIAKRLTKSIIDELVIQKRDQIRSR